MKTKLMALLLVAGGSLFAQTHFSIGIRVGAPRYYESVPVVAYRPPCPGPGYVWIDGYQDAYGNWFDGYWAVPPYAGSYWVAPRFFGGRSYAGYWGGARYFDRDDSRFRESREHELRGREWREREHREHGRDFDRGHDRGFDRRDFGRDRH
jgi:hypothetical protein